MLYVALEPVTRETDNLTQGKKATDLLVLSLDSAQLLQAGMLPMGESRVTASRRT